jgi:hypothetical protein
MDAESTSIETSDIQNFAQKERENLSPTNTEVRKIVFQLR